MLLKVPTMKPATRPLLCAVVLLVLPLRLVRAEETSAPPAGPALAEDPVLTGLVKDALEKRPELARAQAIVQADLERAPQIQALPDPVVSLGIQNDGFQGIQIGKMETSWATIMASQTFPWYGKRALRAHVLTLGVRQEEADLDRLRLSIQAEVERAFVDLVLVRDQLGLLTKLETLWTQAEGLARTRYESGEGAQSDILRAQLERSRLKQRRWSLTAEEQRQRAVLNRLRHQALDEAIAIHRSLGEMPDPALPEAHRASQDAEARAPELQKARLAIEQSGSVVDLARKDYFPDLTVSVGVMPRGGQFEPMWQAGLSFTVPVWAGSKQSHAVAESQLRGTAAQSNARGVRHLLLQRVQERLTLLEALLETNRLYRTGLLVQSEATVASTLAQYRVGRVSFASVLEALTGYVTDLNGFYESVAAAQRIDIAHREVSLEAVTGPASGGMGGSSVPGAGGTSSSPSSPSGAPSPPTDGAAGSGSMSRM